MVIRITYPQSCKRALNYNEKKVQKGVAECLYAENFLKPANEMNFQDKLQRFETRNELNDRVSKNTLQFSLNFDEKDALDTQQKIEVAKAYMKGIGYEHQPYLVYEHHDAGHKHLHVVTTNIREDGTRIPTHNIGRNESEQARKKIEKEFGLVEAQSKKTMQKEQEIKAVNPLRAQYGNDETKKQMQHVLSYVVEKYNYTSLEQLNAVLKQYNMRADKGQENSRLRNVGGLYYRITDGDGKPTGKPVRASDFYMKPTLKDLEQKFIRNEVARNEQDKRRIRTAID
jgi:hypothetical protein